MSAKTLGMARKLTTQEVCIDLPGERVQCWRSSDQVKVVLRKHRDVIFDINLKSDTIYTVESRSEFYSPREKKLLKKASFFDGERLQIWVGREFKDTLVLTANGEVLGKYKVSDLDAENYGSVPKDKPEPLLIVLGKREQASDAASVTSDPLKLKQNQLDIFSVLEPKLPLLASMSSTRFDYSYSAEPPEVREYVAVTDVLADEIRPEILKELETGPVTGKSSELFATAPSSQDSHLYAALGAVASTISGNEIVISSWFKESGGYLQEHFRSLDKILMTVRIEKKSKGHYGAVLKGKPFKKFVSATLAGKATRTVHENVRLGSKATSFIDGGFSKSGKAGYGGRRIMLTAAENFKGGVKVQIIGTVIDLFVDVHSVYFDEKGSKDLSEFLGRAGVSLVKAGLTAALGSVFAAGGIAFVTAGAAFAGLAAAPVIAVVAVAIGGYILAAAIVDFIDDGLEVKRSVANFSR